MTSNQSSNSKTNDDVNSFRFVKDSVKRKDFQEDSSVSNLINYIKESQIRYCYKRIINLINMNVEDPSTVQYEKLQIDDAILKIKVSDIICASYPFYSKCNVNNITRDLQII